MIFNREPRLPDSVTIETDGGLIQLCDSGKGAWEAAGLAVTMTQSDEGLTLTLAQARAPVQRVTFIWREAVREGIPFLNDQWERGYGDLEWHGLSPARVLPWYFAAWDGVRTWVCGVKTQPAAFCHWVVTPAELRLVCDVRSGKQGLHLQNRSLTLATVVTILSEERPFATLSRFCHALCDAPLLPQQPVYGFNDWYYAYGENSRDTILRDAQRLVDLSPPGGNRPFCVIDAGWQVCGGCEGGPWDRGNRLFGDMGSLAEELKAAGARPGIWVRLLRSHERLPESWMRGRGVHGFLLDPSLPEVLDYVAETVARFSNDWGYELIKHDFSTYDIFGTWGFEMGAQMTGDATITFQDRTRTTAEIIIDFYRAIRQAAGKALVIGCNTVGHLAAGTVELQRTGDDTSGREWERTRKMGVNTLAFRMPQHNAFFAADADCVGLTDQIPWHLNRQWLDLLARSGTPLFVSADPAAIGAEQAAALREAFHIASQPQSAAEPLDWLGNAVPRRWKFGTGTQQYDWYTGD